MALNIEDVIRLRRQDVEQILNEQFGTIRQRAATRISQLGRLRSPARETLLAPIERAEFGARQSALTGLEGQFFDARAGERALDLKRERLALQREMFGFEQEAIRKAQKKAKRRAIGGAIGGIAGGVIGSLIPGGGIAGATLGGQLGGGLGGATGELF